jgi:hypothetical protein
MVRSVWCEKSPNTQKGKKVKITKKQLKRIVREEKGRLIREMSPDEDAPLDEDEAQEDLLAHVEIKIDELIDFVDGSFLSPGARIDAFDLMREKIRSAKYPRGPRLAARRADLGLPGDVEPRGVRS